MGLSRTRLAKGYEVEKQAFKDALADGADFCDVWAVRPAARGDEAHDVALA
jgi:hypothetical protein